MRSLVLINGKLFIVPGQPSSGFIAWCPKGWEEGDEDCVTMDGKKPVFHVELLHKKRLAKHEQILKQAEHNNSSVIDRIKGAYFGKHSA